MKPGIDAIISEQVKENGPGAAVMVVKGGKAVYQECFGLANLEWQIPIQADTVFRLASITKQFTATAVMMLQEQGKIHINDPLTKYLPTYPTSGHDIRIHHLLTHTSGIKNYTAIEGWFPDMIVKDMTPQAVCDEFAKRPFDFKPGTQHLYSNSGYHLLGMIIAQITQTPYATFIQEHIFKPLQMHNSTYMNNEPIIKNRASGYMPTPDGFQNAIYLSMTQPYAAGGLGSTLNDLLLWDNALRTHTLVSKETLEQMWTPVVLDDGTTEQYGFGWGLRTYRDHRIVRHSGGIPGFNTFMVHLPDDETSLYLLSNDAGFDTITAILNMLPFALALQPIARKPVNLPVTKLEQLIGTYRSEQGWAVKISYENNILRMAEFPSSDLLALDDTHFYLANQIETEVTFTLDESGQVASLTLTSPLVSLTAVRAQDEKPD